MSLGLKANVDGSGAIQVGGTDAINLSTGLNATFVQNANLPNTFGFKNRIINGDMKIDQRNAGASVTPTDGQYVLDRFNFGLSQASKLTAQQSSTAPAGFVKSFLITSSSAYTVGSSERFLTTQAIEGLNISDLAWGTASAAAVTLSFWVRSSLTGTFGGALRNSALDRSYPFSYTISSANTWEQKSVTIAGDTSGTWLTTNGVGIYLSFSLGSGSTVSNTAGAWAAGNFVSATGATSVVGTSGATFYITGVQLEKGSTATSFDYLDYGRSLAQCQRYFSKSYDTSAAVGTASTTNGIVTLKVSSNTVPSLEPYGCAFLPVTMRTAPTVTSYGFQGGSGKVSNYNTGTDLAASSGETQYIGTNGFSVRNGSGGTVSTANFAVIFHYAASAEL